MLLGFVSIGEKKVGVYNLVVWGDVKLFKMGESKVGVVLLIEVVGG